MRPRGLEAEVARPAVAAERPSRAAPLRVPLLAGCLLTPLLPAPALAQPLAPVPAQYRLAAPAADLADADAGADPYGGRTQFLFTLPATFSFDSLTGLNVGALGNALDRPRATVRYTWFSHASWDMKIGLSTTLDPNADGQRFFSSPSDRLHVGGLPTMHVSGEGRLADHWMLSVNAEGLRTARGLGLDMDLRVDYSLTRDLALFGSYRLTDSTGDGQEIYGFMPSNAARFGVRLRF